MREKKLQTDRPFEFDVMKGEDWLGGRHGVGGERQELRKERVCFFFFFSNIRFRRDHELGQYDITGLNESGGEALKAVSY